MSMDLASIWAAIIVFGVVVYVILDGFDLGVGILFSFSRSETERDLMMNSIAPIWDGNETWLILGGASLFAAFPAAYSILLSTLYLPLILMLVALILRGVAFEFRFKANTSRHLWNRAFAFGSWLAAFSQGVVLGSVVQGIPLERSTFLWLTPFTLFCGFCVVCGYALLGATWLIMKTEGGLRERMRRRARVLLPTLLAGIAVISIWTPLAQPEIAARWFTLPNFFYLSQVPFLTFLLAASCWYVLKRERHDGLPFLFSIGLFILSYAGLVISVWPYIVPRQLTIQEAAADQSSLRFLLYGAAVMLPVIIGYSAIGYRVFRGKIREGEGYH